MRVGVDLSAGKYTKGWKPLCFGSTGFRGKSCSASKYGPGDRGGHGVLGAPSSTAVELVDVTESTPPLATTVGDVE